MYQQHVIVQEPPPSALSRSGLVVMGQVLLVSVAATYFWASSLNGAAASTVWGPWISNPAWRWFVQVSLSVPWLMVGYAIIAAAYAGTVIHQVGMTKGLMRLIAGMSWVCLFAWALWWGQSGLLIGGLFAFCFYRWRMLCRVQALEAAAINQVRS